MRPTPAALGIGTATFLSAYGIPSTTGGAAAPAPGADLLRAALAGGVRYLDTAAEYGDGEQAIGRVRVEGVRVCTKIAARGSIEQVRASVTRLGAAPDTILLHSAAREQIAAGPGVEALRTARADGLTRRIGASTYGLDDAAFALAQEWVDVVQVEYSILNQSLQPAIERARPEQEVVVRSVLCKGLLTARRDAAPALVAPVRDAIEGIERCAREWGYTTEGLAIRFALDSPGIDVVLVGVSRREELDAALAAAAAPRLDAAQWGVLAAFDRSAADAAHPERWREVS